MQKQKLADRRMIFTSYEKVIARIAEASLAGTRLARIIRSRRDNARLAAAQNALVN